jgi:hypothetical protein
MHNRFKILFFLVAVLLMWTPARADVVTYTYTTDSPWSDSISPVSETRPGYHKSRADLGHLSVSVSGITGTTIVTLQRKFTTDAEWGRDVETFTEDEETSLIDREPGVLYRIGIKPGEYDSGTITARLATWD